MKSKVWETQAFRLDVDETFVVFKCYGSRLVFGCRIFETTLGRILKREAFFLDSLTLKMGLTGCPEKTGTLTTYAA